MNKLLSEQRCGNCRYQIRSKLRETTSDLNVLTRSFETREILHFQCRRHAPRPSANENIETFWPAVNDDDWCGEWVQR